MKGSAQDIPGVAIKNTECHRVLYAAQNCQLVVIALEPKGESGT
jgi:hypothetical protein